MANSDDMLHWNVDKEPISNVYPENKDSNLIFIASSASYEGRGTLFKFLAKDINSTDYSLWTILFDINNPKKILEESKEPLWSEPREWVGKPIFPLGSVEIKGKLISYWEWEERGIF